jgi:hypothetical protein
VFWREKARILTSPPMVTCVPPFAIAAVVSAGISAWIANELTAKPSTRSAIANTKNFFTS